MPGVMWLIENGADIYMAECNVIGKDNMTVSKGNSKRANGELAVCDV